MRKRDSVLAAALLLATAACASQVRAHRVKPIDPDKIPVQYAWTKEQWTGDERPFTNVRKEIDAAIKAGKDRRSIYYEYSKRSQENFNDRRAAFARAYAKYRAGAIKLTEPSELGANSAEARLADMGRPYTYEYMRVRFLLEVSESPFAYYKRLGERLLRRNPDDYDVIYCQMNVLEPGVSDEDDAQVLVLANQLSRLRPKDPHTDFALGWAYERRYMGSEGQSDFDNAVVAYRQSIGKSTAKIDMRPAAEYQIKFLNTLRNQIEKRRLKSAR